MDVQKTKYLPGGFQQFITLNKHIDLADKKILFAGAGLEKLLLKINLSVFSSVNFIVEDYDTLINSRYLLSGDKKLNIKMMEFDNSDFHSDDFNIVYVQGSLDSSRKNKIVKEIKRILKSGGIFCIGEQVKLSKDSPSFVEDLYKNSGIAPLNINEYADYFIKRNFDIIFEKDLSHTLKKYYKSWNNFLQENLKALSDNEKEQNKKLLKKISHESNAYLNLGGAKFMGFKMLIMEKKEK